MVNNVGLGYEHPEFLNECSAEVSRICIHSNSSDQLFRVFYPCLLLCRGCTKLLKSTVSPWSW